MGLFVKENTIANLTVVENFDLEKYLGRWYDIAHMAYKWQPDSQTNTTATYSLRNDGKVKVYNKGFYTERNEWRASTGKAKPAGSATEGKLLVSFFGPFYTPYNVSMVDADYQYALVI